MVRYLLLSFFTSVDAKELGTVLPTGKKVSTKCHPRILAGMNEEQNGKCATLPNCLN